MFSQFYRHYFRGSRDNGICGGELEKKVAQLEEQNKELQKQLDYSKNKEEELQKVLCNYDNLLKKVLLEKGARGDDKTGLHLANLEKAFFDLLQKYEKAKLVVQGFQGNEAILKRQVAEYEKFLGKAKARHENDELGKNMKLVDGRKKKDNKRRRLLTTI